MPAVPRSARAHMEEVRRWREVLLQEQCLNPVYATDSPDWEVWFALEHEEQRWCSVQHMRASTPLPPVVRDEDLEEETAY